MKFISSKLAKAMIIKENPTPCHFPFYHMIEGTDPAFCCGADSEEVHDCSLLTEIIKLKSLIIKIVKII